MPDERFLALQLFFRAVQLRALRFGCDPRLVLLRERLPYETVGTIGQAGLIGSTDLVYYAGAKGIADRVDGSVSLVPSGEHPPGAEVGPATPPV